MRHAGGKRTSDVHETGASLLAGNLLDHYLSIAHSDYPVQL
ncbi:hypothetical protein AMC99_00314 [Altererythrobacter epoxidivorans]|uniref:Uncharacterized protein n=1 Tax=Altererythrobacter epoxidivorans TaxID=361183 RepID=A0A0M4LSR0_9SPHN|nr:hypothetical protein AMC99_00314 [Altererythrobacter epoxidivorans]